MNYAYMLRCGDGSLYTGWTNDLAGRLRAHQAGLGGKYTRSHLPVTLVYYETFETKEAAMSREWHLKRLPRSEKLRLIAAAEPPILPTGEAVGKTAEEDAAEPVTPETANAAAPNAAELTDPEPAEPTAPEPMEPTISGPTAPAAEESSCAAPTDDV